MFQPLYTGASGLQNQQRGIDVIGNNIANVDTHGFKASRLDFQDTLYTRMFNKVDMSPEMNLQRGTGMRIYQSATQFEQGAATSTERNLDFMLEGNGFFVFENPEWDGEDEMQQVLYSRNGSLYISEEEEGSFLVDAQGRHILDENMDRIMLIGSPERLSVTADGVLSTYDNAGVVTEIGKLFVTDFVNPGGLQVAGNGYYLQTTNTGEMILPDGVVLQGFTEASNVELAEQMTNLVRTQRAYQLAARCVTTADQMMQVCNQLGR